MGRRFAALAALACLLPVGCLSAALGAKPGPTELTLGATCDDVMAQLADGGSVARSAWVDARASRLLQHAFERGGIDGDAMLLALRVGRVVEAHRHWGFFGYDVYLLVFDEQQRLHASWRDHVN